MVYFIGSKEALKSLLQFEVEGSGGENNEQFDNGTLGGHHYLYMYAILKI